jgi:hypothetical protein
MSYCRWSSDDFQCDVYVYQHTDGYISINVASSRPRLSRRPEPLPEEASGEERAGRFQKIIRLVREADEEPIGLSRDGEHFAASTPEEAARILRDLAEEGYNVPDRVIEALLDE